MRAVGEIRDRFRIWFELVLCAEKENALIVMQWKELCVQRAPRLEMIMQSSFFCYFITNFEIKLLSSAQMRWWSSSVKKEEESDCISARFSLRNFFFFSSPSTFHRHRSSTIWWCTHIPLLLLLLFKLFPGFSFTSGAWQELSSAHSPFAGH